MSTITRTFLKRIYLDTLFSRSSEGSNHWVGSTVKGFRVIGSNNAAFDLSIVADPDNGAIQGLPLKYVKVHNYAVIANSAVFENKIVQSGVYVDVLISVQDDLIYTGEDKTAGNAVTVSEGTNHSSVRVDLPLNIPTLILPADDQRVISVLQMKSGAQFWIGNPTAGELNNADYKNICQGLTLAAGDFFEWRNAGALYAKTDVSACIFSLIKEVK